MAIIPSRLCRRERRRQYPSQRKLFNGDKERGIKLDGYTLLLVGSPNAINATLYEKLSFNFVRDIAPIASSMRGALLMVVNPSVPAKTLSEFIAYAKANPGKLSYGSGGVGGITHITPELFKLMPARVPLTTLRLPSLTHNDIRTCDLRQNGETTTMVVCLDHGRSGFLQ